MQPFHNVRIIGVGMADGGRWFIKPGDARMVEYVRKCYRDMVEDEPGMNWQLQTRGDIADWHDWKA